MPMIKRIILVFVLLIALLVAALVAALIFIDPNDYKDEISGLVREHTGRELHIVDDLSLSVFPWLGVETGELILSNAEGFGPEPFARLDRAKIKVKLMPLIFSRSIEVDTVSVDGLKLRLELDRNGRGNWEDLAGGDDDEKNAPAEPAELAVALPAALTIGGLELNDASLRWLDAAAGSDIEVHGIALRSGKIEPGQPVDLSLGFDLRSASPAISGRVDFSTRITAQFDEQRVQADALRLQARLSGADIPGGNMNATFSGDVKADLDAGTVEIPAFTAGAFDLRAEGALSATDISDEPRIAGRIAVAEFSPRKLLAALGETPPETTDPAVLNSAQLSLQLAAGSDDARITNLNARIDDTRLTGAVTIPSFERTAAVFEIDIDAIDLDRYLPPGEEVPPGGAAAAPAAALVLPMETLRELDLQGKLAVERLKATGLQLSRLQAQLRAKDGVIRLSPMTAALYDGNYSGDFTLDARGEEPRLALDTTLSGVQAGPLLNDLMEFTMLSGTADIRLKASTQGSADADLRRNLNGDGSFSFRNGAIKGFNAAQLIREAKARLDGKTSAGADTRETDFTDLTGTLAIANGVLRNSDLRGNSPYLRLGGEGQVDLVRELIDYRLRVRIVDTSAGQGAAGLDELKGLDIPIRISGKLSEPGFGLDSNIVRELLSGRLLKELGLGTPEKQEAAKQQLQEKAREVEDQLQEKAREKQDELQEKLQDKLKGLFR